MSKLKLTGWYRGNQKPVRVGVYERFYVGEGVLKCYWDGKDFGGGALTSGNVRLMYQYHGPSNLQNLPWRGVAE